MFNPAIKTVGFFLVALFILFLPICGQAEEANYKEQAFTLMNQKQFPEAYNLLKSHYQSNEQDDEYNLLLGLCAMESQKPEEAISCYKAILAKNPNLPRVQLELAKAYTANGQSKEAKAQLRELLATNPPEVIGEKLKRFLSMLEAQKETSIRATMGYMYDSNVNQGPTNDKINFAGLEFTLDSESLKHHDTAILTNISIENLKIKDKNQAWQTGISYYRTDYKKYSRYDSDQLHLSTGPMFKKEKKTIILPIIYNYTALDREKYNEEYGISPQVQYELSARKYLIVSGMLKKSNYVDDYKDRNSTTWGGNIAQRYVLNDNSFCELAYGYKKENADVDCYSSDSNSLSLGYYTTLPSGYSLFVQPSVELTKYKAIENPGDPIRDEKEYVLVTNISKTQGDWSYVLGYTYIRNDSNVNLHDYDRNQISLQISKSF